MARAGSLTPEVIESLPSRRHRPRHANQLERTSLGGAAGAPGRRLHGRPRLLHRQRRPPVDGRRPGSERELARVGRRGLRADLRRLSDHRRPAGRRHRSPACLCDRPRLVHSCLVGMRLGAERGDTRAGARRAGRSGRRPDAAGAVDHRCGLPRAGLRARAQRLWRRPRPRGRGRSADRRRAGRERRGRARLALVLPDQRARRAGGPGAHPRAGARVARPRAGAGSTWRAPSWSPPGSSPSCCP